MGFKTLSEFRRQLTGVLSRVVYRHAIFVITSYGKPVALLLPYSKKWEQIERETLLDTEEPETIEIRGQDCAGDLGERGNGPDRDGGLSRQFLASTVDGPAVEDLTHAALVRAGRNWLVQTKRCSVVAAELSTAIGEQPDVIGWTHRGSCLIECKTSRADYHADFKKAHRRADLGVGQLRWYLTPPGLLKPDELPEDWGLLELRPSQHAKGYYIRQLKKAVPRVLPEGVLRREINILVSVAWRAIEAQRLTRPLAIGSPK